MRLAAWPGCKNFWSCRRPVVSSLGRSSTEIWDGLFRILKKKLDTHRTKDDKVMFLHDKILKVILTTFLVKLLLILFGSPVIS